MVLFAIRSKSVFRYHFDEGKLTLYFGVLFEKNSPTIKTTSMTIYKADMMVLSDVKMQQVIVEIGFLVRCP